MTPSINTRWFKQRLADCQISQRQLAKLLNIDPAAMSLMLAGRRKMQLHEATAMAAKLGVPMDTVLGAAGIAPPTTGRAYLLLAGTIRPNGTVSMTAPEGPRRVERPTGSPEGTVALRIDDRGPLHRWTAYYVSTDQLDPAAVGRLAVIQPAEGSRVFAVLQHGSTNQVWTLQPLFGVKASEDVRVRWASPVTWLKG